MPTKTHPGEQFAIRDLGLAAALAASGWPVQLEDRGGTVYFIFQGDSEKFKEFEDSYWSGRMKLPAKDLLMSHRSLKDRLYSLKSVR
jgi:hypothetical protein